MRADQCQRLQVTKTICVLFVPVFNMNQPQSHPFSVASGFLMVDLVDDENAGAVTNRIENIVFEFTTAVVEKNETNPSLRARPMLQILKRNWGNAFQDERTGAILVGNQVGTRRLNEKNMKCFDRLLQVLHQVQDLLRSRRRVCQRQLYYTLIKSFESQAQLNSVILDVSAMLRVPRYALNIGAATRGVIAGCVSIGMCQSTFQIDCEHVGVYGWPIPGDIRVVTSMVVSAKSARYILVVEKFGIFTTLVQYRLFDSLPCILVCGKGYPSVSTRAMVHHLESRLR